MKYHDKTTNIYSVDAPLSVPPTFFAQREIVDCPHCHRTMQIAVRPEYVDWESVAEDYRRYAEKLQTDFHQVAVDVELMHGENPAAKYFHNRIMAMFADIRKEFGKGGQ